MARRSGLGKGLDALLPSTTAAPAPAAPVTPDPAAPDSPDRRDGGSGPEGVDAGDAGGGDAGDAGRPPVPAVDQPPAGGLAAPVGARLVDLPVDRIRPNRHQPRATFDDEALDALTASIEELGVLQPILVREVPGSEDYELIAGERRWRASRQAGRRTIPAVVRTLDDVRSLKEALVENLQREDLNAIEEALAYQQLADEFSLTQEEIATAVGRQRSTVANTLRLLHLPAEVQTMVAEGRLTAGHARALLGIDDHTALVDLALRIEREGLSVRATEDAVRRHNEPSPPPPPAPARGVRPAALLEVEERLADLLDTRVHVDLGAKSGKVVVTFADLEDLDRIFTLITMSRGNLEAPAPADD